MRQLEQLSLIVKRCAQMNVCKPRSRSDNIRIKYSNLIPHCFSGQCKHTAQLTATQNTQLCRWINIFHKSQAAKKRGIVNGNNLKIK